MQLVKDTPVSRRDALLLPALSILPVVLYVILRYLGMLSLAKLAVIAAAGMIVGAVFLTRPRFGIYFILFYTYSGVSFYLPGPTALAVMLVITTGVLLGVLRGDKLRLPDGTFLWALAFFLLFAVQSMLFAYDPANSVGSIFRLFKSLLLVFLLVHLLRTPLHLQNFGRWIFLGGVATVVFGMANLKTGAAENTSTLTAFGLVRFMGAHGNPNYAAAYMTAALPMGLFLVRYSRTVFVKLLALAGILLVIGGVFATFSRSALFAFAVVFVAVLAREFKNRKVCLTVLALLLVGILITPKYYWARFWAMTDLLGQVKDDWSILMRLHAAARSLELFLQNPLTGIGLDNFRLRAANTVYAPIGVHNAYLEILCATGILGLTAYLAVIVSVWRQLIIGMRTRWSRQNAWISDFSFYLSVSFLSTLINALFRNFEFNYTLWIPMAGAFVIGYLRRQETQSSD